VTPVGTLGRMEDADVQTIVTGLFNAKWKLDRILEYFGEDDEAEEDEADPT
jgi:hypothetical protein